MKTEAARLINILWQDPDHRKALRLISECIPTPRKIWETQLLRHIKTGIKKSGAKIEVDSITYYPDSASPREIKVQCGGNLKEQTDRLGFHFCYMLHCRERNPDIGSEFLLRLMAWCDSPGARQVVRELKTDRALPASGERKDWGPFVNIWTGGSYILQDLGTHDLEGLTSILLAGVSATYLVIEKAIAKASATAPKQTLHPAREQRGPK